MAAVQFTNYFATELAAPVAPADTSIEVLSDGNLGSLIVGGNWIYLTLVDANSWNNNLIPPQTREIVKVTAISGSAPDFILTVTRGEDNTTAQSFARCDIAAFLLNAQSLYDIVGGGGSSVSITASLPATATPSPITGTGVIGVNTMTGDSGAGGTKGAVPAPGAGDAAAGKFLKADATWAVPAGGGGAVSSVSSTDHILTFSPTTGAVVGSLATTTKGDLIVRSASNNERLPVGSNNQVLTADSSQTLGVKWSSASTGGALQSQEFTASGTFNVPAGVTGVWATLFGAGGGGSSRASALGGGGGGSGESVQSLPVNCTGGGTITVTIGAKGTGAVGAGAGVAGGDTSITSGLYTFTAKGGLGGTSGGAGGNGGGAGAGTGGPVSNPGDVGVLGDTGGPTYFGGSGGGGGGSTTGASGGAGGIAGGFNAGAGGGATAATQAGGGGGATTIYGLGGVGGAGGSNGTSAAATSYGAGGGGAGGVTASSGNGGDGAPGYVLIVWVA